MRARVRTPWVSLVVVLIACGGAEKPRAAAPVGRPPDPAGLVSIRAAYKSFVASPGSAAGFDALAAQVAAQRDDLAPTARAEADLVLTLAGVHVVATRLEQLGDPTNAAHDVIAATVLPLAWGVRPLDGESAAGFRDRLCEGDGAAACAGALPDFWGAALAYVAAGRLAERAGSLAAACACQPRYQAELGGASAAAEAARVRDSDERPGWSLEQDVLARSAFATPDWQPGDVRVRVRVAELLPARRKAVAARLAEARAAAATPAENGVVLLELDARTDVSAADLAQVAAAARDAGFPALLLAVRVAAPPHPRGYLRIELAARPVKGATALTFKKKDGAQALVDQVDAAHAAAENPRVVWVVK